MDETGWGSTSCLCGQTCYRTPIVSAVTAATSNASPACWVPACRKGKKSSVKPRLYFCLSFCGITAVFGGTGSGVNVTVPFENNHACFVLSSSLVMKLLFNCENQNTFKNRKTLIKWSINVHNKENHSKNPRS